MKTFNIPSFVAILITLLFSQSTQAQTVYEVSMGNQYTNEVFFSLTSGEVKSNPRNNWDIAFFTNAFSAGIITNDGANVGLWAYPGADISGWETFDTTGMASWTKLYNNTSDWEEGSFNRFTLGHPDYGWGIYSMTTHNVIGDSLYLIQPVDGQYRKLQIVKKISTENKFIIRHAFLDGTNDITDTLEVNPYTDRQFMAFSFTTGIVDRDPPMADWDLLFTRYYALVQNTPYPVNGVLHKSGLTVAQANEVAPDFSDWSELEFVPEANVIGHDWKTINMSTFQWEITDSLAYFVRSENGPVNKVVFDAFSGSGTGTTTLTVTTVSLAGLVEQGIGKVNIYPNPTTGNVLNIEMDQSLNGGLATLMDLRGKIVREQNLGNLAGAEMSLSGIASGTYLLRISNTVKSGIYKVIISQ